MNANDPGYNCSEHVITNHKLEIQAGQKNMVTVTKILQKKISKSYNTVIYSTEDRVTPIAVVS
jgi:hypothetical protein